MGASGIQTIEEIMGSHDDHLICGCRLQMALCGMYFPNNNTLIYEDFTPNDCPGCVQVWLSNGCPICGCNSEFSCDPCVARYHIHLDSTDQP